MSKRQSVRLCLERLEERELPSAYFVSPTGSDGGSGASGSPWLTLLHAANVVHAGDTVTVRAGTYAGFELDTSGTSSARIVFQADSGVTINAGIPVRGDGINLEGASFVTINGFNVVGVPHAGIRSVTNTDVIISNNVCDQNNEWGIFSGFSDNLTIENNVASRTVVQHGIYVSNTCVNPIVRDNTVWGNNDCGIHMNGDISQGGIGIITGALVEGNIIYNNGAGGGSGINCDGVQNSIIRNNLLYNNHASGISLYQIDAGDASTNDIIANNTILLASDGRWDINIQNASTGAKLVNNILYDSNSNHGVIDISSDSLPSFSSDFNSVMNRFTTDDGTTVLTLAQWQAQTSQDKHSIIATPAQLFENVTANNYHLIAGSPAIDKGTSTNAPATDLDGNPRPSGSGYDIGAYEFQFASGPTNWAVADFAGLGVFRYTDATGWKKLNTGDANSVAVDATGTVVASMPYYGTWLYKDSTGWVQLTPSVATQVAISNGVVAANFPWYGVQRFVVGSTAWQRLNTGYANSVSIDSAGTIVASMPGYGVWRFKDATGWVQLCSSVATQVSIGNGVIAGSFTGYGVQRYTDATGWQPLGTADATSVAVDANGTIVAEMPNYGVWEYTTGTGWTHLAGDAASVTVGGSGIVWAEFTLYGVNRYLNGSGWSQLYSADAYLLGTA
jgi:parallel beta-helix repeat protein